jgi:hypothetical protein
MIVPERYAPLSATIACAVLSVFIHMTVEPTEMLIGFGVNPPLAIVALTVVAVGAAGELPFAQPTAVIKNVPTHINLIQVDIISSFRSEAVQTPRPRR